MKIKLYTPSELSSGPRNRPAIRINMKAGLFTINYSTCKTIGLIKGSKLSIGNDPEFPDDWFIKKTNEADAFILQSNNRGSLCFNSCPLARIIFSTLNVNGKISIKLMLSSEAVKEFWPLITAPFKKPNK